MRGFMKLGGAIVVLSSVLAFGAAVANGETGNYRLPDSMIQAGKYSDLTFWRSMRLGAASLVDPDIATKAKIVYVYPDWKMDQVVSDKVKELFDKGDWAIGSWQPDGSVVIKAMQAENIKAAIDSTPNPVLVTNQKDQQLGPSKPIITWAPTGAVIKVMGKY